MTKNLVCTEIESSFAWSKPCFYSFLTICYSIFKNQTVPGDEKHVTEYAWGVTSDDPELFIQEEQPDRKSIIQSWSDTLSAEILAVGKHHVSAHECSLMYIPLKIYTPVGECVRYMCVCVHLCVFEQGGVTTSTVWSRSGVRAAPSSGSRGCSDLQGSVTWTPSWTVMKSDCLIRGKQKCCQSVWTSRQQQQQQQPQPGRFFAQRPTYGILMMERRLALPLLLLMVSKCSPVKMYFLFG